MRTIATIRSIIHGIVFLMRYAKRTARALVRHVRHPETAPRATAAGKAACPVMEKPSVALSSAEQKAA